MLVILQLYKVHTLSLLQAHIMIAGVAGLLFAKWNGWFAIVLSLVKAAGSFFVLFSWTHKFHTQSALCDYRDYLKCTDMKKQTLHRDRYGLCCMALYTSIIHVDIWVLWLKDTDSTFKMGVLYICLRTCVLCVPIHTQIPTLNTSQIRCCISSHTGSLQWEGCISRGQMMALFSLYQVAGCPRCVFWLHDAAGLILMI